MRADDDPLIRKRTFAAQDCADVVRLNCAARQICFDGDNNRIAQIKWLERILRRKIVSKFSQVHQRSILRIGSLQEFVRCFSRHLNDGHIKPRAESAGLAVFQSLTTISCARRIDHDDREWLARNDSFHLWSDSSGWAETPISPKTSPLCVERFIAHEHHDAASEILH